MTRKKTEEESMYPTYRLEQYILYTGEWVPVEGYPESDKPHTYDRLREGYELLVKAAKYNKDRTGYRITADGREVDTWENGTGERQVLAVVGTLLAPYSQRKDIEARVLAYNRIARELGWPTWGEAGGKK
jgi:hypothetical protein